VGSLQSQISSNNIVLNDMRQQLTSLQSQLSSKQTEADDIGRRDETRIGVEVANNLVSALSRSDEIMKLPRTLVLLTSVPANEQFRWEIEKIINNARAQLGGKTWLLLSGLPDYKRNLDAPLLKESGENGITIHGRNQASDYLMQVLGNGQCVIMHQTDQPSDQILTFYRKLDPTIWSDVHDTTWIDIGNDPLLKSPGCLDH